MIHRARDPETITVQGNEPAVGYWRVVAWVLFGLLIVAHGCHAGRDTELMRRPIKRLID